MRINLIPHEPLTTTPLTIGTSIPLATIQTDDNEILTLTFGLDTTAIASFTAHSCNLEDAELQLFTTDYKRIYQNSYASWYTKGRFPYALTNASGELAAIIWFGPKEVPASECVSIPEVTRPWHTFAIRTYPPYRGKRLALPFAETVFRLHAEIFPQTPIWLDTVLTNEGAIRLYKKLGFVERGTKTSEGEDDRLIMTRT